MHVAPTSMMHLHGLILFTFLFPGAARRRIRIGDSHYDASQQTNILTKALEVSGDMQEALFPFGSGTALLRRRFPQADALHAVYRQGPQLRARHGQPLSTRNGVTPAWQRLADFSHNRSRVPNQGNPLLEHYGRRAGYLDSNRAASPLRVPRRATVALHAARSPEEDQVDRVAALEAAVAKLRAQEQAEEEVASGRTSRLRYRFSAPASASGGVVEPDSWSEALEERVLVQMVQAFDNYAVEEVQALLRALVQAAAAGESEAERSLLKLAGLTQRLESLQAAAAEAGSNRDALVNEARTLYSQLRMWGKDGERWLEGSWLGYLNDLGKDL